MRPAPFTALGLALLCGAAMPIAAQEEAAADSHMEMAEALLDFLSRTDACLATCTDEKSTQAALPQLRGLKEEAAALAARQAALPEPTVQDYMAVQSKANDFLQCWQSVRAHIERMQQAGLLRGEIREILHLAPEES